MNEAILSWRPPAILRALRTALLSGGFLLLVALAVARLAAGDGRGVAYLALGAAGLAFVTRRGLPTAICLAITLDGLLNFLGADAFRVPEAVAGMIGAGVAAAPLPLVDAEVPATAANSSPGSEESSPPAVPLGPPHRLRLTTVGRFEATGPEGDLTTALSRRPILEFLWLYLLARKLAGQGPISRATLAEELSPRIDSDEQGNRLRRRLSDMQRHLPRPLLERLVLAGRQVDFTIDGCEVDVLRLSDLRERLGVAGEIPPPTLVAEAEAALEEVGFGKFLPQWDEIEKRLTNAKGSAGDTVTEVRVSVSEARAAIVLSLAGFYRAAGQPARAIPLLTATLDDNPELEDAARMLVATYLATGQSARAREAQRRYLAQEDE